MSSEQDPLCTSSNEESVPLANNAPLTLRGYRAYRPEEVPRVLRLLDSAAEGCPGHGPAHLLVESAAEIGLQWDSRLLGWERLGLPVLSN